MSVTKLLSGLAKRGILPKVEKCLGETVVSFTRKGKNYTQIFDEGGKLAKYEIHNPEGCFGAGETIKANIERNTNMFGENTLKITKSNAFAFGGETPISELTKTKDCLEKTTVVRKDMLTGENVETVIDWQGARQTKTYRDGLQIERDMPRQQKLFETNESNNWLEQFNREQDQLWEDQQRMMRAYEDEQAIIQQQTDELNNIAAWSMLDDGFGGLF